MRLKGGKVSKKRGGGGFKDPPRSGQFKPGQSGNPRGRPKGSLNFSTVVEQQGRIRHKIQINGKTKWLTQQQIAVAQLWKKALDGDLRAIGMLHGMESKRPASLSNWPPDPDTLRFTLSFEEDDPPFN